METTDDYAASDFNLKTATQARALVADALEADNSRSQDRAQIEYQLNGGPPFDRDQLRSLGQSYRSNFNPNVASAQAQEVVLPRHNLLSDHPVVAEIRCGYGGAKGLGKDEAEDYSNILVAAMSSLWDTWTTRPIQMAKASWDSTVYGVTVIGHRLSGKWQWDTWALGKALPPRTAGLDTGEWSHLILLEDRPAHKLATDAQYGAGWVRSAVTKAIDRAMLDKDALAKKTPEQVEELRRAHISTGVFHQLMQKTVPLAHIVKVEIKPDGTPHLRYVIIDREAGEEFMVDRDVTGKSIADLATAVPGYLHAGMFHSLRGWGHQSYNLLRSQMRFFNQMNDRVALDLAVKVVAQSGLDRLKAGFTMAGPLCMLPEGLTLLEPNTYKDVQPSLYQHFATIAGGIFEIQRQYRAEVPNLGSDRQTTKTAQLLVAQHGRVEQNVSHYILGHYDGVVRNTFERMKGTEEFKRKCIQLGVPEDRLQEVIKSVELVQAPKPDGSGNAELRRQLAESRVMILERAGATGKRRREAYRQLLFAHGVDWHNVNRLLPAVPDEGNEESSFARAEHEIFDSRAHAIAKGITPARAEFDPYADSQDHYEHAVVHVAAMTERVQRIASADDLIAAAVLFEEEGAHVVAHLDQQNSDRGRADKWREVTKQFEKLAKVGQRLMEQAQQLREEQAQAQQEAAQQQQQGGGVDEETMKMIQALKFQEENHAQKMQHKEQNFQQRRQERIQAFRDKQAMDEAKAQLEASRKPDNQS